MTIKELMDFNFWEMIIRTTAAFTALLVLARILGKKQLSQLTFFHYATGITFGSIAAEMAGQTDVMFVDGLIALVWWTMLTLLMSYISLKSKKGRVILDDQPSIIVKKGMIMKKEMNKERLHINDVMMMLREQSIFSLSDVEYAILETNGELSVLKKIGQQEATKTDVHAAVPAPKYLPTALIADGELLRRNLLEFNLTEDWLMKELRKKGVETIDQVFLAQLQTDGTLFIDLQQEGY